MKQPKSIYVVTDTETTKREGSVFDIGWIAIDRHGNEYSKGSYLASDVLAVDNPYYTEKIARYWRKAFDREVEPIPFSEIKINYNNMLKKLLEDNENTRIYFSAFNATFDTGVLGKTSKAYLGQSFLEPGLISGIICIWNAWANSCPLNYTAEVSDKGNLRTNAEAIFRYEFGDPTFIEEHTAYRDCIIEAQLLLKVLKRKKRLDIANNPKEIPNHPWKKVMVRTHLGKELLAKQGKAILL